MRESQQTKVTEYNGASHENGGVPLGNTGKEVEGGETRFKDFVFSDRILVPETRETFAEVSKKIKKKYADRPNDVIAQDSLNKELERLAATQEQMKKDMAPPPSPPDGVPRIEGGEGMGQGMQMQQQAMQQQQGGVPEGQQVTPSDGSGMSEGNQQVPIQAQPEQQLGQQMAFGGDVNKLAYGTNNVTSPVVPPGSEWKEVNNYEMPTALSNDANIANEWDAYATANGLLPNYGADKKWGREHDKAWNANRDNFLKSKGYIISGGTIIKDPDMSMFDNNDEVKTNNNQTNTGHKAINNNSVIPVSDDNKVYTAYPGGAKKSTNANGYDWKNIKDKLGNAYNKLGSSINGAATNLSGLGQGLINSAGDIYDIYRGSKGGSPEYYDRVQAAKLNRLDPTRTIQMQKEMGNQLGTRIRQTGGQGMGQYLNNMTQAATRTQAGIANTMGQYDNQNTSIANQEALNRQNTQASNINLDRAQGDINARERDEARNTLQSGLTGLGQQLGQSINDNKARSMEKWTLENFIDSPDYDVTYGFDGKPIIKRK